MSYAVFKKFCVMLIGATGCGKSSLANLIVSGPTLCDDFGISMFDVYTGPASGTIEAKCGLSPEGIIVIDTPGLFHSEEREDMALSKLHEAVNLAPVGGIDVVAFLTDGRTREDTRKAFDYVKRWLGYQESRRRLLVIQSRSGELALESNINRQQGFIQHQMASSALFRDMIETTGGLGARHWLLTEIPSYSYRSRLEEMNVEDRWELLSRVIYKFDEFRGIGKWNPSSTDPLIYSRFRKTQKLKAGDAEGLRMEKSHL